MPKTKTTYDKMMIVKISDIGNQMIENLWRLSESDSKSSFIRDAVVFYMNNAMNPKIAEYWNKQDVPEINDFGKSYSYEDIKRIKQETIDYMQERITNGIKFKQATGEEQKKINSFFKNIKK